MGGSVGATSNRSSGQQQTQIDPVVQGFVNNDIIGGFRNLTGNVFAPYADGNGPSSFIAPQSQDTLNYYSGVRNLTTPNPLTAQNATANQATANQAAGTQANAFQFNTPSYQQASTFNNPAYQQAAMVGDLAYTQANNATASRGSTYVNDYLNPATNGYINDALNVYDTGVDRAMLGNRAARDAGTAFGDRAANADAVLQADAARGRGALAGQLGADAFRTAVQAAANDAGLATNTSLANAASANDANKFNAGVTNQARFTNAATQNAVNAANTNIANTTGMYNNDIINGVNANNTNIANQTGMYNTGVLNNNAQFNAGLAANNNQFNANALNNNSQFNAGVLNNNSQFNANTNNQFALANDNNAWNRSLTSLGLLGDSGAQQNAYANQVSREPIDLILQAASIAGGVPYGQTQTSQSRGSGKAGSVSG